MESIWSPNSLEALREDDDEEEEEAGAKLGLFRAWIEEDKAVVCLAKSEDEAKLKLWSFILAMEIVRSFCRWAEKRSEISLKFSTCVGFK